MITIDNHSKVIVGFEVSQVTNILVNGEPVANADKIPNVDAFYAKKGDIITFSPVTNYRPWFGVSINGRLTNYAPLETTLSFTVCTDSVYLGGYYVAPGSKGEIEPEFEVKE